jgi:hypothetical protein
MSLQALYSFDHVATADLPAMPNVLTYGAGCTIQAFGGRDNTGCLVTTDNLMLANSFTFSIVPHSDVAIGAWVIIEDIPVADGVLLTFNNPAIGLPATHDKVISLTVSSDGSLRVWAGAPGVGTGGTFLAGSASGVINFGIGRAQYIELRTIIGPAGAVVARVDGVNVINSVPINTQLVGVSSITNVRLGNPAGSPRTRYDDVYVTTGLDAGDGWFGFKGVLQVEGKLVNAPGEVTQWTPTAPTGVNFSNVNENTPDVTTFNYTTGIGLIDLYNVEDVAYIPIAIQVDLYMVKTGAGPSSVGTVLRPVPGGANFVSAAQALAAGFRYYGRVYTKNPNGNIDWTMAAFNQLQVGVSKVE